MSYIIDVTLEGAVVELEVKFEYVPAEPQTYDYPGYDEEINLKSVWHKKDRRTIEEKDFLHHLSDKGIQDIKAACLDHINNHDEGERVGFQP